MVTAAIIAFVFILALIFILSKRENTYSTVSPELKGSTIQQKFPTQHLAGHPTIEEEEYVYLVKEKDEIKITTRNLYLEDSTPNILGAIPFQSIRSVEAEDHSGIEKKFSLGRFMLLGAYAFAWLKKEPKEKAYLVINWSKDGKEYVTIFRNEEAGSLAYVNAARRAISSWIKHSQS